MLNDDLSKKNHHIFGKIVSFWATLNRKWKAYILDGVRRDNKDDYVTTVNHVISDYVISKVDLYSVSFAIIPRLFISDLDLLKKTPLLTNMR